MTVQFGACTVVDMTTEEATGQLDEWRRNFERRDLLVRVARDAGLNINQISAHTGLSRTTVYTILGEKAGN